MLQSLFFHTPVMVTMTTHLHQCTYEIVHKACISNNYYRRDSY